MLKLRDYIYTFSKDLEPIAKVASGTVIKFKVEDCFGGQIRCKTDELMEMDWNHANPATGPVYVEGAEPGDVIAVDILDIEVDSQGTICTIPHVGPFWENYEKKTYILRIQDGLIHWDETGMTWPIDPMVGVIGLASDERDIPTAHVSHHGGNMDSRLIRKGTTVWLPVRVAGGLLAMGDLHATMGDGEVAGNGIEVRGSIIARVRLVKNFKLNWALTETADAYYVNTCGPTCDDAIREGYLEMHRLIMQAYGLSYTDAALYMSMQGFLEANQACLVDEAGGNSFRTGTPKLKDKPRLIG